MENYVANTGFIWSLITKTERLRFVENYFCMLCLSYSNVIMLLCNYFYTLEVVAKFHFKYWSDFGKLIDPCSSRNYQKNYVSFFYDYGGKGVDWFAWVGLITGSEIWGRSLVFVYVYFVNWFKSDCSTCRATCKELIIIITFAYYQGRLCRV